MNRPASSMENARPSGLKPPTASRLPTSASSRPLQDVTQSDLNNGATRNATAMAPPGGPMTRAKHKLTGSVSESNAKQRKTLAERAGEPLHQTKSYMPMPRVHGQTAVAAQRSACARPASSQGRPQSRQLLYGGSRPDGEKEAYLDTKKAPIDTSGRIVNMDKTLLEMDKKMSESYSQQTILQDLMRGLHEKNDKLEKSRDGWQDKCRLAERDLDQARTDIHILTLDLEQTRKDAHSSELDQKRAQQQHISELELNHVKEMRQVEREGSEAVARLEREMEQTKRSIDKDQAGRIADLTSEHWEEVDRLRAEHEKLVAELRQQIDALEKSGEGNAAESASIVTSFTRDIAALKSDIDALNVVIQTTRSQLLAAESRNAGLEQEKTNLLSKTHFLEGNQEAQSEEFTSMTRRLQVAEAQAAAATAQLRKEETVRRRLNAQILELKGNIRVYARIRPVLPNEEDPANIEYPDGMDIDGGKAMLVHAPTSFTATGKERNEKYQFSFDRVFGSQVTNAEVFEECRELVQSVIDGYNVSILSYGQTGSGKTFGMSGVNGIITSSIDFLLAEMHRLQQKGWEYEVHASFVEVYNETLNDLLGDAKTWDKEEDVARPKSKTKHEIHHDAITGKTTVSNLTTVALWPAPEGASSWPRAVEVDDQSTRDYTQTAVARLLETAAKNRRVAATKANERSSRSHSVFVLTLKGTCAATGESSEGILNLVDLAGSERLKHSGAEGGRAKETAAINTSLKSLGDVIEKVGSGGHVPYRNSKLTFLLQSSLGGISATGKSSRTLMLLHLSPLQAHWQESKTSLQFGTKVHGTHIGTAKRK